MVDSEYYKHTHGRAYPPGLWAIVLMVKSTFVLCLFIWGLTFENTGFFFFFFCLYLLNPSIDCLQPWTCSEEDFLISSSPHRTSQGKFFVPGHSLGLPWWLRMQSACNAGDPGLIPGSGRSPGEGNGYPLQYSCLENSKDRWAWWATGHGITKSQTWLSNEHYHQVFY